MAAPPMILIAMGLLLPAEIAGVLWVCPPIDPGISCQLRDHPGVISLLMFLLINAMPTLVGRFTTAVGSKTLLVIDLTLLPDSGQGRCRISWKRKLNYASA